MDPLLIAFVGSLPGAIVSVVVLIVTLRNARSVERLKGDIQQDVVKFTKWHDKRLSALEEIYVAFVNYLDFLRRYLYWKNEGFDVTPMHEFRNILERQLVYLDQSMAKKIELYQYELLLFHNTSLTSLSMHGEEAREAIRFKLDLEIPDYLRKLRDDINEFNCPNH